MSERPLSLFERLEHRVARALVSLPHPVQVKLAGGRPVERDGLTLHPELQLLLALRRWKKAPAMSAHAPGVARRKLRREALVHSGEPIPVGAVRDLEVPTVDGPLRARHYVPDATPLAQPLLVFLHGGGFALGDLDTHDAVCRLLCRHARLHVLSVDYRLAPEAPFPAAIDDARAAFRWACDNAAALGADPDVVGIGGDSAGGNLSAVVAQLAAREGTRAPAVQLLLYPALDRTETRASVERFADGFFLTRADIDWFSEQYVGTCGADARDPRVCPLLTRELGGLAPALVVTAGFDPLRDEGDEYARRLSEANVPVVHRRYEQLIHGFASFAGVSRACREATLDVASALRRLIDRHADSHQSRTQRGSAA